MEEEGGGRGESLCNSRHIDSIEHALAGACFAPSKRHNVQPAHVQLLG